MVHWFLISTLPNPSDQGQPLIRPRGCERCSNRFPHCQLCGPEATGPDGLVVPWKIDWKM